MRHDPAKEAEYQLRVRYLTAFVSALGAVSIFAVPVSVTGGLIALALTEVLDVPPVPATNPVFASGKLTE
jgi:hypothetical protein